MPARPSPWREEFGDLEQVNWWIPTEVKDLLRGAAAERGVKMPDMWIAVVLRCLKPEWRPGDNAAGEIARRTGLFPDA